MRRYNILSRILLILSVTNLALAAPVLVQEKRPACVDVVHVPKDVITVLGKRMDEFRGWLDIMRSLVHPFPLEESEFSSEFSSEHGSMESHTSDPGRESMDVESDAPPPSPQGSTESEQSHTPPSSPDWSTKPEQSHTPPSSPDWSTEPEQSHTPPSSPDWSTEPEHWHTPSSSLASSTESASDLESDSDRWSTISNAPSTESQFENLQAVNNELKGKVKVERRTSGTTRVL